MLLFSELFSKVHAADLRALTIRTDEGYVCFEVELSATWFARARGLMFRQPIYSNQGMLFQYDGETPVTFWMKNVAFPLDIIFISSSGDVVKIHEWARPMTHHP
ncbi:MAG: DUF192 domain-containing protein [Pseudomonadota bacterium]